MPQNCSVADLCPRPITRPITSSRSESLIFETVRERHDCARFLGPSDTIVWASSPTPPVTFRTPSNFSVNHPAIPLIEGSVKGDGKRRMRVRCWSRLVEPAPRLSDMSGPGRGLDAQVR
jgi:hypothetical protein